MANIIWTPPDGWVEESGAHISFKSPCDCSAAGNLVIGSNSYSILDAMGRTITGMGGAFVSGAVLDFILDCENLKAYLQNSAQADYIVEQGTSGIWTYRKWNSGIAECWGIKSCGNIAVTSSWGALYEGSNMGGIAYPSGLFISQPAFFPSAQTTKYGICGIEIDGGSKTTTPSLYLLRATAQTVQGVYLSLVAKGRWK